MNRETPQGTPQAGAPGRILADHFGGPVLEEWLTVAQAARLLNISERTVQRRCEAGKLNATRITTEEGKAWRIDPSGLPTGADRVPTVSPDTADTSADTLAGSADNSSEVPTGADTQTADIVGSVPTSADSPAIGADRVPTDYAGELIAQLRSENEFLRATIEAERREAALTIAALRDAIKAMPKALPAPGGEEVSESTQDAPGGAQMPKRIEASPAPVARKWWQRMFMEPKD